MKSNIQKIITNTKLDIEERYNQILGLLTNKDLMPNFNYLKNSNLSLSGAHKFKKFVINEVLNNLVTYFIDEGKEYERDQSKIFDDFKIGKNESSYFTIILLPKDGIGDESPILKEDLIELLPNLDEEIINKDNKGVFSDKEIRYLNKSLNTPGDGSVIYEGKTYDRSAISEEDGKMYIGLTFKPNELKS